VLREYTTYYNTARPHRSLGLIPPLLGERNLTGPIRARPVLGGLHHAYERAA
jgi:transposase InsO family protein